MTWNLFDSMPASDCVCLCNYYSPICISSFEWQFCAQKIHFPIMSDLFHFACHFNVWNKPIIRLESEILFFFPFFDASFYQVFYFVICAILTSSMFPRVMLILFSWATYRLAIATTDFKVMTISFFSRINPLAIAYEITTKLAYEFRRMAPLELARDHRNFLTNSPKFKLKSCYHQS